MYHDTLLTNVDGLLSNTVIIDSGLPELFGIEDVSAVDDQWPSHGVCDDIPVGQTELFPLGEQKQCVGLVDGVVHVVTIDDSIADTAFAFIHRYGVVSTDRATGILQQSDDDQCCRLTHVVGFRLEGQSPKGNGLAFEVLRAISLLES